MNDCDCEKKKVDDTWLDKNDYGDEFLREESFKIIRRILRDKEYYSINQDAIFNVKLEEDEINEMSLEDVNIDYSYLNNDNFKSLQEDQGEIELLEEDNSSTDTSLSESEMSEEQEEIDKIERDITQEEKLETVLSETEMSPESKNYEYLSQEEQDEITDISKTLVPRKRKRMRKKKGIIGEIEEAAEVTEEQIDKILNED